MYNLLIIDYPGAGVMGAVMKVGEKMVITKDEDIERTSRSLKAMSHPLRLKILCTLGEEEISVQDIAEFVGTSQSNISQMMREVFCNRT